MVLANLIRISFPNSDRRLRIIRRFLKLIGLDELFVMKENKFRSAQKKKIKIITDFINTRDNTGYDADTVEIKLERNVVENMRFNK